MTYKWYRSIFDPIFAIAPPSMSSSVRRWWLIDFQKQGESDTAAVYAETREGALGQFKEYYPTSEIMSVKEAPAGFTPALPASKAEPSGKSDG